MEKEKVKNCLKDKYNFTFIIILVSGIIIRIYHFLLTKGQPLWWDEADYMAYAKNLAGLNIDWIIATKHNSLYPYLAAGVFKIGLGEMAIKLFLQVIPSIQSIVLVYYLANEMYKDKRIGVIASFLMTVFWVNLFNTSRFHVDISGLFLGLLAIYVFWKGFEKKEKILGKLDPKWALTLAAFFAVASYSIRRGYFLFGVFIAAHILLTRNWKDLAKDKHNWIALVFGIILIFFVEKVIFISAIGDVGGEYFHQELPISFAPLNIFASFFKIGGFWGHILFYLFWIGFILIIGKMALSLGYIKKEIISKANLLNFIIIAVTLLFFMVVLRSTAIEVQAEPRWYLPIAFSAFICIAHAGITAIDYAKKNGKKLALIVSIVLAAILLINGFYQYKVSDSIVKEKVSTYSGIREAGFFLKEISNKEDLVLTLGQPQVEYYSERKTLNARVWAADPKLMEVQEHFDATLKKIEETPDLRFLVISFTEPAYPDWMCNCGDSASTWEIPFMATKIDFSAGTQDIKEQISYGNLTFKLITVKQEVFIYEIIRKNSP